MATEEGLRRSTRARKPVKNYAIEQAEEEEMAVKALQSKRKRKALVEDDEDVIETKKAKKKATKKAQPSKQDESPSEEVSTRKPAKASSSKPKRTATNRSWHGDAAERRIKANNRNVRKLAPGQEETRLRDYVTDPPKSYTDALKRANTQRMFILDRERGVEEDCHAHHHDCPCETVQIAGSTGNVYTVTISHMPSCTCPVGIFSRKNGEKLCKHALYVLHNVLKAAARLKQQNAFLTSELKEIFANAPALPSQVAEEELVMDGNRKAVEDDCPICCMEFEDGEEISWCRAACGNNIHTACFDQWANTKMGRVTCPFCRTPWDYGDAPKAQKVNLASIDLSTERDADGYRNVRYLLDYD